MDSSYAVKDEMEGGGEGDVLLKNREPKNEMHQSKARKLSLIRAVNRAPWDKL